MHEESTTWVKDTSSVIKEVVGKWLFFLYAVFYAVFIIINVVSPSFMGIDIGSLNMAIAYGFGLILMAMLLAFAYNHISTRAEILLAELAGEQNEAEESETENEYQPSIWAIVVFVMIVAAVLMISFHFSAKRNPPSSYLAAGGNIHWSVNGVAFAGDYLSAASFWVSAA